MATGKKKGIVFVGLSGGVDSSIAALLLREEGYDVTGVFMRCYNIDGCAERDAEDARRVAEHLHVPFYVFDFEEEYKRRVVDYMIEGYRAGITPNPDVACNREIKFGLFLGKALSLGADYVATGHYISLSHLPGASVAGSRSHLSGGHQVSLFSLTEAADKNKDQSYFLWTLTQDDLKHCLFPLGGYQKPEVRKLAREAGLPTATKKDSQGVCFLGDIDVREFLKRYIPSVPGPILNASGVQIGSHDGAAFYTFGQRHGLNIGAKGPASRRGETPAHYVVGKSVTENTVTVAEANDDLGFVREVSISVVNFTSGTELTDGTEVFARVRYRQPVSPAVIGRTGDGWVITFKKPQRFVAPGQSLVFYDRGGAMLGGGVIV